MSFCLSDTFLTREYSVRAVVSFSLDSLICIKFCVTTVIVKNRPVCLVSLNDHSRFYRVYCNCCMIRQRPEKVSNGDLGWFAQRWVKVNPGLSKITAAITSLRKRL